MNSNALTPGVLLYAGNQAVSSLVSITWKEIWYLVRTLQLIEKLKTLDVTTKSIEKLKTLDVTTNGSS
jgi:hypothetical protein